MSKCKNAWWEEITSEDFATDYSPDWGFATSVTTSIYDTSIDDQFTFNFDTPKKLGIDIQKKVDNLLKDANISIVDDDGIPF